MRGREKQESKRDREGGSSRSGSSRKCLSNQFFSYYTLHNFPVPLMLIFPMPNFRPPSCSLCSTLNRAGWLWQSTSIDASCLLRPSGQRNASSSEYGEGRYKALPGFRGREQISLTKARGMGCVSGRPLWKTYLLHPSVNH